jgi:UDP-3-O-[3-hydroxymyristoyl] glucosamine N-acyltransferase LpxD
MTWDDKILQCKPEEISYDESGIWIKEVHYKCENPRLEFTHCLNLIGLKPAPNNIHPSFKHGLVCSIGGYGFGYVREEDGTPIRMNHFGNVVIEENVVIGSSVCIDRAVIGSTILRKNVKVDNLVHIAHGAYIGQNTLIVAGSVIGGSARIGDNCFIGMGAMIKNKVKIGNGCTIGAGAIVLKDVPDGETWVGNPARKLEK